MSKVHKLIKIYLFKWGFTSFKIYINVKASSTIICSTTEDLLLFIHEFFFLSVI